MKNLILVSLLLVGCGKGGSSGTTVGATNPVVPIVTPTPTPPPPLVAATSVVSTGFYAGYPASNTINSNPTLFMTTPALSMGSYVIAGYQLAAPTDLSQIRFEDNYTNTYAMGDLDIYVSANSSNGWDGTWQIIKSLSSSNNSFTNGDGTVSVTSVYTKWVRLVMTYNGSGDYGSSFYLSKIYFYGH